MNIIDFYCFQFYVKYDRQIKAARKGLDCGGLLVVCARQSGLTELEVLGYADFPNNGKFEQLLNEHADFLNFESDYPHKFDGTEFLPGDLLAFDYKNGEGIRHVAIISKWEKNRYWVIDAQPDFGVSEHPLAHPFSKAKLFAYRIRGLIE